MGFSYGEWLSLVTVEKHNGYGKDSTTLNLCLKASLNIARALRSHGCFPEIPLSQKGKVRFCLRHTLNAAWVSWKIIYHSLPIQI